MKHVSIPIALAHCRLAHDGENESKASSCSRVALESNDAARVPIRTGSPIHPHYERGRPAHRPS